MRSLDTTFAIAVLAACGPMYQQPGAPPLEPLPAAAPSSATPAHGGPPGAAVEPSAAPAPTEMSAPRPAPKPQGAALSPAAQTFLAEHNRYRAKHCAPPLAWSPQLATVAQRWANTLKDKGCMFGHSGGKYGENLAAGTTGAVPPEEVVRMWYDEVKIYDFKKGAFSMETGHFTQLVWTTTTQVGCGMVQCKGMDIWVCEYDPPGNWEGRYRQHVLPTSCKK